MKTKILNTTCSILMLVFLSAFGFQDNPPKSGWYQQFMPSLSNMQVSDIFFLDSLTGWAVTGNNEPNDTSGYILKTIDGGDNWNLKFSDFRDFSRVKFINESTGFVCGGFGTGARIYKSTDGGESWFGLNIPGGGQIYFGDMSILNEDTIWVVASNALVGGVFRTTNGGSSWQQQASFGNQNPQKIYMLNANIGFISTGASNNGLRRTTDGGATWTEIPGVGGFTDLKFIDENTGWKALTETSRIRKTTNGGVNWFDQWLPPQTNFIFSSRIRELSIINKDTIWGSNPRAVIPDYGIRGILYISTDGGSTWGYQLPDPEFNIPILSYIDFVDKNNGWAYHPSTGVRTVTGGDTTYYITSINQVGNEIPTDYILHQNFPNPFNPTTIIKYELRSGGMVKLKVFDIRGREVSNPVKDNQQPGVYELNFSASEYGMVLSSGIYFYSLYIDDRVVDTKKMLLVK